MAEAQEDAAGEAADPSSREAASEEAQAAVDSADSAEEAQAAEGPAAAGRIQRRSVTT